MAKTEPSSAMLFEYVVRLGDNSLVLGQRLGAWCGHAPALELDMSLTNLALDLIGQARLFLDYAGRIEGKGRDEDALAFHRDVLDFKNLLIVEQPNGDFAVTIARQFLFSSFQEIYFAELSNSCDAELAAIAAKSLKEVAYHTRLARDWMIRLGDGTEESRARVDAAIADHWRFIDEMFEMDDVDLAMIGAGIGVDAEKLRAPWDKTIAAALAAANLERPMPHRPISGGRHGHHSEHLGHLLADMQFLPRAYPEARW